MAQYLEPGAYLNIQEAIIIQWVKKCIKNRASPKNIHEQKAVF